MIIIGCVVDDDELFRQQAEPGLNRVPDADADVWVYSLAGTIGRTANLILDHAQDVPDLEAVILVRRDTEITDPAICATVRDALSDPDVAIVGAVGAANARTLAWWRGTVSGGPVSVRYSDRGAGTLDSYTWGAPEGSTFAGPQRVVGPAGAHRPVVRVDRQGRQIEPHLAIAARRGLAVRQAAVMG